MKRMAIFSLTLIMSFFLAFSVFGEVKKKVFKASTNELKVVNNEVQVKLTPAMVTFIKNAFGPDSKVVKMNIASIDFRKVQGFSPKVFNKMTDSKQSAEIQLETDGNDLNIIFLRLINAPCP